MRRVDQDKAHQEMNQCVIEDIFIIGLIKQQEKKLIMAQKSSPYSDIDYMKSSNIKARLNKYPNFTHDHDDVLERKAMVTAGRAGFILKQQGCFNIDKLK